MSDKERRVYEVTANTRTHWKSDGTGGTVEVEGERLTELVEIEVDWVWLVGQIGERAVQNTTKRASSMAGAVEAKVIKGNKKKA